ncbi:MAG: hypothetical protein M3362_02645 [Acidobacteriota bacterium]|nr:hypothetical protein [Acidobacteriota bacterium]
MNQTAADDKYLRDLTLQLRLEAAKEAQKRARGVFLVSTIVSLVIIIATWNASFSWIRNFVIEKPDWAKPPAISPNPTDSIPPRYTGTLAPTAEAQRQLVIDWVRSQTITITPLGINLSVSDLSVLGSLSLFFVSVWFYFSLKRENRVIGSLLRITKNEPSQIRNMIFTGVVSHVVFADIGKSSHPIDHLDAPIRKGHGQPFTKLTVKILFFLPLVAFAMIILTDVLSLFYLSAPFRDSHQPVWDDLPRFYKAQAVIMELIAIFIGTLTGVICWRILCFYSATEHILRQYGDRLEVFTQTTDDETVTRSLPNQR